MRQSYKITRLDIQHQDTHTASWKGFGRQAIKGTQHIYSVKDGNYRSLNKWTIAVRVPNAARGKIIVQPITPPGKKIWACESGSAERIVAEGIAGVATSSPACGQGSSSR